MLNRLKTKEKKIIQWLVIFCSITIVTLSLIGDKGLIQLAALKKQQRQLEQDIEDLKLEKKKWIFKIQSLKKNRTYVETIAREKLGMVRSDEIVYEFEQKAEDPKETEE